jgi:hypothetical protein
LVDRDELDAREVARRDRVLHDVAVGVLEAAEGDPVRAGREALLERHGVAGEQITQLLRDRGRVVHRRRRGHDRRSATGILGLRESGPFDVGQGLAGRRVDGQQAVAGGDEQRGTVLGGDQPVDRRAELRYDVRID